MAKQGDELVPVGKAYFGFTDEELLQIDRFVRRNTTDRFGPVREVVHEADQGLVLEVAFEGLQRSTRHKSGLAMRFPRINRLRWDKPPGEADRLERLETMLATDRTGTGARAVTKASRHQLPSFAAAGCPTSMHCSRIEQDFFTPDHRISRRSFRRFMHSPNANAHCRGDRRQSRRLRARAVPARLQAWPASIRLPSPANFNGAASHAGC